MRPHSGSSFGTVRWNQIGTRLPYPAAIYECIGSGRGPVSVT